MGCKYLFEARTVGEGQAVWARSHVFQMRAAGIGPGLITSRCNDSLFKTCEQETSHTFKLPKLTRFLLLSLS